MGLNYMDFLKCQSDVSMGLVPDKEFCSEDHLKTLVDHFPFAYYVINYRARKFDLIHNSKVLGYSDDEFLSGGLQWSLNNIHPDDARLISDEVFPFIWDYIKSVPDNQTDYRFSLNYRYIRKDKSYMHIQQHIIFIDFDINRLPVRNFSVVSDVSALKNDTSINLTIVKVEDEKESIVVQKTYFHETSETYAEGVLDLH